MMPRKIDEKKKSLAYILFMTQALQKDICERIEVTPKTLQKWIDTGGWREKLAAKTVTRTELVNKTLVKIYEELTNEKEVDADKLSKLAALIEKLDKKDTPVMLMETFIGFGKWLQTQSAFEKDCDLDFIKKVTRYQDKYITEKMST